MFGEDPEHSTEREISRELLDIFDKRKNNLVPCAKWIGAGMGLGIETGNENYC